MPTGNGQIEVVFRLTDGTEITNIEDLTNVLTFLEEHQEYVKVVRCKDCKWFNDIGCAIRIVDDSDKPKDDDYCSFGERRG